MVLLLAIARETGVRCTSVELAAELGANTALVRKLLKSLARANLVIATVGKHGGIRLGRAPENITLLEIYAAAVDDKRLFTTRLNAPDSMSKDIELFFEALMDDIEVYACRLLAKKTIAQSLVDIRLLDAADPRGA